MMPSFPRPQAARSMVALIGAAVLVPAVLCALVAAIDRDRAWRDAEDRTRRTAEVLHEHALKVFETFDLVLDRVSDRIQGWDWDRIGQSEPLHRFLKQVAAEHEQVDAIWLTDAVGRPRSTGLSFPAPALNLADRDYFRAQQQRDRGTYISEPYTGRVTHAESVAVSRRRGTAGGAFDGTIHITASADYFARYWQTAVGDPAYAVALVREDGTLLARAPRRLDGVGQLSPDGAFRRAIQHADAGIYTRVSARDGVERIVAYRKIGRYPVYISVRIETAAALAGWRARLVYYGLATAAAMAVLVGLALMTARQRSQALRSEATVRESEARYRLLAEHASDVIVRSVVGGERLYVSPSVKPMLGYEPEELVGGTGFSLVHPQDAEHVRAILERLAPDGPPVTAIHRVRRKDGSYVWAELAARRITGFDGRAEIVGTMRDITARQEAEEKLLEAKRLAEAAERRAKQAQTRLEEAIEAMPEGFALYDGDDRLVVCNERARQLYGDLADVLMPGETHETLLRAFAARSCRFPSTEAAEAWIAAGLAYHRAPVGAVQMQLADGRWVRFEERRTESGDTVGMRVDITGLKAREASFKLLFKNNPVPMWVYDRETLRILNANGSALVQYGYGQDEFLALTMDDLRPAEERAPLRLALASPEPPNGRYGIWRHRRADGTVFEVDIVSRRFPFDGRPAALVAAIDVTAQRDAEAALRQAKEQAEAASRTKSQFLANMSHELRTPLNAVIGFSEIIKDAVMGPVDTRYREYARDIHQSGQHLLGLIGDVLDLSKIEAGHLELFEELVDLRPVLAACRHLVGGKAREGGVTFAEAITSDVPPILADELRLKQILLNLLSNAVKFTPTGGRVTISVSASAGEGVVISVADTGIGMRPEEIPAALEPFRQVDGALNRRFEGTGLGLPLARMLVDLHGGTLEIESEPERGTTVRVRLPESRVLRQVA